MKSILGISAFYHDSAACIILDGEIVAAIQEERFTRKKHEDEDEHLDDEDEDLDFDDEEDEEDLNK